MTMESERTVPYARRAEVETSVWHMGALFGFLADSKDTGGRFGLMEVVARKGGEPPRHIHNREDEAVYVLEGEVTCYVGEENFEATPGTFVFLPRDVPHSFTFETEEVRMLVLVSPGGFEEAFRTSRFSEPARTMELPPPPESERDAEALVAEMERYGSEAVGPPGLPEEEGERKARMTVRSGKTAGYMRRAGLDSLEGSGPLFTILADSKDTDRRFSFAEIAGREGSETPSRHIHHREDEAFYILEGKVTFYVGDETFEASPGTFVFMPMGVPHSFTVETGELRALGVLSPGGLEEFFRNLPSAAPDEYGIEFVGPPGPPRE